jgi:hypothetical protein
MVVHRSISEPQKSMLDQANQKSAPEFVKVVLEQAKEMLTSPDSIISEWQDLKTVLELLKHQLLNIPSRRV